MLSSQHEPTRQALQRVATHLLARRRFEVSGRFGLRASPAGIATPAFGEGPEVLRLSGLNLVREQAGAAGYLALVGSTLRELADFAGVDLDAPFSAGADTPPLGDPDARIEADPAAAAVIFEWYDLGTRALDQVAEELGAQAEPATIQIWPEHFDVGTNVAVQGGSGDTERVNLGFSPGDTYEPGPYAYLGPWGPGRPGDPAYWNAPFGAVLRRADLDAEPEPLSRCIEFLRAGLSRLAAS